MANQALDICCESCKSARTIWDFAHNHLTIATDIDPTDECLICHEPYNTIHPDTGRKDIPVRITGLHGCTHTYGFACLEYMWATYMRSARGTVPGHICMLDKTKWFARAPSMTLRNYTNAFKEKYSKLLSKNWEVDKDTARYYLFREPAYQPLAQNSVIRYIQRKSEFELCIRWAVEMRNPVNDTTKMLRTEQSWNLDAIPADEDLVRQHFGTAEKSWAAFWARKMDPFDWKDFQGLSCPHRIRITVAALATAKGAQLYAMVKKELPTCRQNLSGRHSGNRDEASRVVINSAAKVADQWITKWGDEQLIMIRYVAVTLMCAELQREKGMVMEHLPGFAGTGWNYMSWNTTASS